MQSRTRDVVQGFTFRAVVPLAQIDVHSLDCIISLFAVKRVRPAKRRLSTFNRRGPCLVSFLRFCFGLVTDIVIIVSGCRQFENYQIWCAAESV
jgi:hypothetical protein